VRRNKMNIDPSIFQFDADDCINAILRDRELNLVKKTITAIDYILESIPVQDNFKNVQETDYGYYWSRYLIDDVDLIVRRYSDHVTLYTRFIKNMFSMEIPIYQGYMISIPIKDDFYDIETEVFSFLNIMKDQIINGVKNQKGINKPKGGHVYPIFRFVEDKYSFSLSNQINMVDNTLFALEELSTAYLRIALQKTKVLNKLKIGQILLSSGHPIYKITDIYENGVELLDIKRDSKEDISLHGLLMYYSEYLPLEDI
jgi:hypothetical protein